VSGRESPPARISDALFRALVENSVDAVALVDADSKILYVSPSAPHVMGHEPEEMVGTIGLGFVHPDDTALAEWMFETVRARPAASERFELRVRHRDGHWQWLEVVLRNCLEDPDVRAIVANFRDVTEKRRAERVQAAIYRISESALEAQNLNAFFASVHEIVATLLPARNFYIALHDEETNLMRFPYFVDEFDPPPGPQPRGRGLTDFVLRTGFPLLASPPVFEQLREAGEVEEMGTPSVDWLGVPLKIRGNTVGVVVVQSYTEGVRFRDGDRKVLQFLASQVAMAIERRNSEEEMRLFEHTLGSIAEIATITDLQDRFTFVNEAFCRTYGYEREEVIGRHVRMLWSERNPPSLGAEILEATRKGGWKGELWNRARDGREFPIELSTSLIRNREGKILGLVGISEDVTERQRSERIQSALYRIAETAGTAADLPEFYREIHRIVGELMDARNFYVALADPTGERLVFPYFVDEVDPEAPDLASARGLTGYVMRTGQPLLASPERFEELIAQGEVELVGAPSLDWLGVPLKADGRSFGALVLQTYSENVRFDERDRDVLTFVSHEIAAALERKRAQEEIREAHELQKRVLESTTNAIFAVDGRGIITLANSRTGELAGFSPEALVGKPATSIFPPDRRFSVQELFDGSLAAGEAAGPAELELLRPDGSTRAISLSTTPLYRNGAITGAVGTAEDITERKRAGQQIAHLAFHDPLTGLPNRMLLKDRLEIAVSRAQRSNKPLAVLFLDLDRFKVVNDSLGHDIGDLLLQSVARRLTKFVREADTVARQGGDEFVLLLSDVERTEDVLSVAEKILENIRMPFVVKKHELYVTTSIGISLFPTDGSEGEVLVRNADSAMYRAKEQGRDNFQLFSLALSARALDRLELESGLRRAIAQGQFVVYYQPIVDIATGAILGTEALLRWNHPTRGLVGPSAFIPLAEENGLIVPIGAWVLRAACEQAQRWRLAGHRPLALSVNLSARQLRQQALPAEIADILSDTGLPADALHLEITESVALGNPEASLALLSEIKDIGVHLTMDDFGTGYSSLGILRRLPFDTLKIDQSFTREMPDSPGDAAIAKSIIRMGHVMNLNVIAEGVESTRQLEFLRYHRCDQAQGYLFSPPVPADEFGSLLAVEAGKP
jgi:diguanylate cyclase (GGDEF)-like protein/PAS domain S-box-containing protein